MDIKDVCVGLYQSMLDTNKSFYELASICKRFTAKQNRVNKALAVTVVCLIGHAIYSELRHNQESERIDKLEKAVDELKEADYIEDDFENE